MSVFTPSDLDSDFLSQAWAGKRRFCLAETRFGTGVTLLAAAKLFTKTAKNGQYLDLVSVEAQPLSAVQLEQALKPWRDDLFPFVDKLVENYPTPTNGFHRLWLSPTICLTFIIGDAAQAYAQLDTQVDYWVLNDCLAVENNPTPPPTLLAEIARLSHAETTLTVLTPPKNIGEALKPYGFSLQESPKIGAAFSSITAKFTQPKAPPRHVYTPPQQVHIYGAGIAGASCAFLLNKHNISVQLTDSAGKLGMGASGNLMGIMGMRFLSPDTQLCAFYASAFEYARRFYLSTKQSTVLSTPVLYLEGSSKYEAYLRHTVDGCWPEEYVTLSAPSETSDMAGVTLNKQAIVFKSGLSISPQEICKELTQFSTPLCTGLNQTDTAADVTVLATGHNFTGMRPVRGQTVWLPPTPQSLQLKAALQFGGYFVPTHPKSGFHVLGATFERGEDDVTPRPQSTEKLLTLARQHLPHGLVQETVHHTWVGVRAQSDDKFPLVGFTTPNTFVSTGHGSHGLTSAPLAAEVLLSALLGLTPPLGRAALKSVCPTRFEKSA